MDKTENNEKVAKVDIDEDGPKRFSVLVLMASILSIGSLAWSTWSFIDLYKVDALTIDKLGGLSLISLSAAATMDVVWSATMVAQYQGQKLMGKMPKVKKPFDYLPLIGWVEALFVAGLLGYHGTTIGGGAAAFAAVLPVFTKLTWTMALNGLKDPSDLTDDEKAQMAAEKRKSRLTLAKADATAEQHAATMILKDREHEAALAEERRKAQIERERVQSQIERDKLEREARFEAEKAELEGVNELKEMRQRLNAQLQIASMRTQTEITMERLDAEQDIRLRSPLGFNLVQGQVVSAPRPQLTRSGFEEDGDDVNPKDALYVAVQEKLKDSNLTEVAYRKALDASYRKATLAARYFAADAAEGGITKAAFAKANETGAPRMTEATTAFPLEWFVENGLASWMNQS